MMNKNMRRIAALALAAALLLTASMAGAVAVEAAGNTIELNLACSNLSPAEALVPGDVLRLEVSAQANFSVYSNFTIVYYDSRYFAPVLGDGSPFAHEIWGGDEVSPGITDYLADCGALVALCGTGGHSLIGSLNAANSLDYPAGWDPNYAALAVKAPYDTVGEPAPLGITGETALFAFYLKAIDIPPTGETADIFFAPEAVRSAASPNGPMMYYTSASGQGDAAVRLSAPLRFTVEPGAASPVRVTFNGGDHGSIAGDFTAVRNIPGGTTIAQQMGIKWPTVEADTGWALLGWAYSGDPAQTLLPGDTPLTGTEVSLTAVWGLKPVTVHLYLTDLRKPAGQQAIPVASLSLYAGDDYSALVPGFAALETLIDPIGSSSGYELERFGAGPANSNYTVPPESGAEISVECARVHRGTWFVRYDANGGTGAPATQEKQRGVPLTLSAQRPARDGYTFQGWTESPGGPVRYQPGGSYTADADAALYAVWQQNPPPQNTGYQWWEWLIIIFLFGWIWYKK